MAQSLPVSAIIRAKDSAGESKKASRDDYRKAKELEEARKAGTVPAEQDEEGHDINPHIPHYIASAPWYIGSTGPTLKHQRAPEDHKKDYASIGDWYKKGVNTNSVATKYRKGACENCGAMTHKKKDCLERPRKIGAKYTGSDIAPDEFVQSSIEHDFEGKRDRWNGYDAGEYKAVVEEYEKIETVKRLLKAEKLHTEDVDEFGQDGLKPTEEDAKIDFDAPVDNNEDKYADDMEMPGTKVDSKQRITVRNLRIREDTAKYLLNLDINSAYYDPKTRSMRENPFEDQPVAPTALFAGENVVRFSGETPRIAGSQLFAWEAYEKGVDLHLQADPTKAEFLRKQYEKKKSEFKQNIEKNILEKYGGEEHLDAPPKELLMAQTETFVEYSRRGDIIKGLEKPVIRSRYEEDVYNNNHTSVWGSFWENGTWGYRCCHSFIKMSYCVGMAGIVANKGKELEKEETMVPVDGDVARMEQTSHVFEKPRNVVAVADLAASSTTEKKRKRRASSSSSSSSSSSRDRSSSSSSESDDEKEANQKKLKAALKAQEEEEKEADRLLALDERRRPYNSMYDAKKLTDEQIEAYQLRKVHPDDPMAKFLKK